MLKSEVVDAVVKGKFNIFAIDDVEDGIKLLTGLAPGKLQRNGSYPKGTFNYLVDQRLRDLASVLKGEKEPENNNSSNNKKTAPANRKARK